MLPSGFLIRPSDGGGYVIHIVDHMDLEVITIQQLITIDCPLVHLSKKFKPFLCSQPWSVPEVVRPLYESSAMVAQKMSMAVQ